MTTTTTKKHPARQVSYRLPLEERDLIAKIAKRAARLHGSTDCDFWIDAALDIAATHANGCPLRLRELLAAPAEHLLHDVLGIARHLDRRTGELRDCFLPRFAKPDC